MSSNGPLQHKRGARGEVELDLLDDLITHLNIREPELLSGGDPPLPSEARFVGEAVPLRMS